MRQLPVAEINGTRASETMRSPISVGPMSRFITPRRSLRWRTPLTMCWTAIAVRGTLCDGFQTMVSPQTAAIIAFQAQTAPGKLKAVMMPTTPSGCHCSYMRCSGRSLCIALPYSCRESPTAKSAMSIISCTSPSASG
jgi:hypothetical protein